jgi:hypothetical protein
MGIGRRRELATKGVLIGYQIGPNLFDVNLDLP